MNSAANNESAAILLHENETWEKSWQWGVPETRNVCDTE
jgi:hypothetical protein